MNTLCRSFVDDRRLAPPRFDLISQVVCVPATGSGIARSEGKRGEVGVAQPGTFCMQAVELGLAESRACQLSCPFIGRCFIRLAAFLPSAIARVGVPHEARGGRGRESSAASSASESAR